jgi:putative esterase
MHPRISSWTGACGVSATLAIVFALSSEPFHAQARPSSSAAPGVRFEVSFIPQAHDGPITGRAFVMITRSLDKEPEPRLQIGRTGVPFFGRDVERLEPEKIVAIDATDLGTPVESLKDVPAGEYFVQAVVVPYTEFRRADGHIVWMHDDQWEGQRWNRSPGALVSAVEHVRIDPAASTVVKLVATRKLPPVDVPPDTRYVKRIRFQSPMLSKFWGRPIYLGAVVLLPRDYDRETISYPVNYVQGHFSLAPPYGFDEKNEFSQAWLSDNFPRMIAVTFQHPTPYFDDSYAVNSVNNGPYGDAIMEELIPDIEKRFRVMREPYARILSGGSTGGWEAAALQIFHPDFFGGAWSYCPDSVTFMDVEGINIYEDENAFYKVYDWRKVPTANSRYVNGQLVMTSQQRNYFELVNGTHGRSGEQIDIWSAVFGPIGSDGYFEPLFDKRTGVINKQVAQYWKEHYDLLYYLRRNWTTVGPKLVDKLFFYTGDVDTYYLNNSTRELETWMKTTTNPHYEAFFMYGNNKPHCWSGPVSPAERLKEIAQFIQRKRPQGATTAWWNY